MQWIKASERLPERKKPVVVKNIRYGCTKTSENLGHQSGWDVALSPLFMYCNTEWLDETPVPETNGWVSVEDRLPSDSILGGETVICYNGNYQHFGFLKEGLWHKQDGKPVDIENGWNVLFWQPLPNPPQSKQNG